MMSTSFEQPDVLWAKYRRINLKEHEKQLTD